MVDLPEWLARARMERGELYITYDLDRLDRRIKRIWEKAQGRIAILEKRKADLLAEYEQMEKAGWTK